MIRFYVVSRDFEERAGDIIKELAKRADTRKGRNPAPLSPEGPRGRDDAPLWVAAIRWQMVFSHLDWCAPPCWVWWRGDQYAIDEHKPSVFWRAWLWLWRWKTALWWRQ